jgi:four helix bundle protein
MYITSVESASLRAAGEAIQRLFVKGAGLLRLRLAMTWLLQYKNPLFGLHVYQAAMKLVLVIEEVISQLPQGRAYLADQLQRAGSSVLLNIAEGAGEFSVNEKIRFYRMARRSATECAGILDICQCVKLIEDSHSAAARELLLRIVAMLTKMTRVSVKSQTQAGSQTFT